MATDAQHRLGGETIPKGSDEMFIGPNRVRVIVSSAEDRERWQKVHDEEMAAAAPPVIDEMPLTETPVAETEPVVEPAAAPVVEEPPAEPEPTTKRKRSR